MNINILSSDVEEATAVTAGLQCNKPATDWIFCIRQILSKNGTQWDNI
jgi:hypothetical protein